MKISTNYGIFKESPIKQDSHSELSLDFVFPMEYVTQWKRCGMVADFLANYQSTNFNNRSKAQTILSTVINELLENAVKFSSDNNKLINLSLKYFNDRIMIETINATNENNALALNNFVGTLNTNSIEDLFFQKIEYHAKEKIEISGLGLLTLAKDYNASLGIKIQPKTKTLNDGYDVHVRVYLFLDKIENF